MVAVMNDARSTSGEETASTMARPALHARIDLHQPRSSSTVGTEGHTR